MRMLSVWHRLLFYFLRKKGEILQKYTGQVYITHDDKEDIASWSRDDVKAALNSVSTPGIVADSVTCPWCIKFDNSCKSCSYGQRHGVCIDDGAHSTYRKIKSALAWRIRRDLAELPELQKLSDEIKTVMGVVPEIIG